VREHKQKEEASDKKNYHYQNSTGKAHRALLAIATLTAACGESTGGISRTATVLQIRTPPISDHRSSKRQQKQTGMFESLASYFAFRCSASLNMTVEA
jgi:hypothetical protein